MATRLASAEQAWEAEMAKARPNNRGERQATYPEAAKTALRAWDAITKARTGRA